MAAEQDEAKMPYRLLQESEHLAIRDPALSAIDFGGAANWMISTA